MNDLLFARARRGDPTAVEQLVRESADWLRERVRRRLDAGLRRDCESLDVVQDAVLQLLQSDALRTLRDEEHLRALLQRIVRGDLVDRRRRRERRQLDPHAVLVGQRSVSRPSEHALRAERRVLLQRAMARLRDADREVLELRVWEQLGFRDIGERLGCTEDSARMRCHRALARLADAAEALVLETRGSSDGASA